MGKGSAILLCLVLTTGCAGFRGGQLDEKRPWPPSAPEVKPSISLSLTAKGTLNGRVMDVVDSAERMAKWSRRTFSRSGLFSNVVADGEKADLKAEIEVTVSASNSPVLALLSGLTLLIVPNTANEELTWKTAIKDGAGSVRGVIEKKEHMNYWVQILLLPVLPFSPPSTKGAVEDLNRSTLHDALEKGYLKP